MDLKIRGEALFTVHNPDGSEVAHVETKNVVCTNGLAALVAAINWSGVYDQNGAMGNPFSAVALAPVYGAVGIGTGTTFVLSSSLASGSTYTQLVSTTPVTIPANAVITINVGGGSGQQVTVSSTVTGASVIPVKSFVANANYAATTTTCAWVTVSDTTLYTEQSRAVIAAATYTSGPGVGSWVWTFFFGVSGSDWAITEAGVFFGATSTVDSGTMFDHMLFVPTVTKLAAQTATLQMTFTVGN